MECHFSAGLFENAAVFVSYPTFTEILKHHIASMASFHFVSRGIQGSYLFAN